MRNDMSNSNLPTDYENNKYISLVTFNMSYILGKQALDWSRQHDSSIKNTVLFLIYQ